MKTLLALVMFVAACDVQEKPPEYMDGVTTERYLTLYDKVADIVAADQKDCAKMASEVDALLAQSMPIIDAANAAAKNSKQLPNMAVAHVEQRATELVANIASCAPDKAVQKAFKRLEPKEE